MINNTKPLDSSIQTFASFIREAQHVVFFGGAGVSTASQIPDFRSSTGLFQQKKYAYSAEYLLSHTCFVTNPTMFYEFYWNEMIYPDALPNLAHEALAKLEERGYVKAVITQNIDGLHQMAGSRVVHELHGSVDRNSCLQCDKQYTLVDLLDQRHQIPRCSCGGVIKPDVVLYEESLPDLVVVKAVEALQKADVLIVGGTSLRVYPAAGILRYFEGKHLVLINKEGTSFDEQADLVFREPIDEVMDQLLQLV